MEEQGHFFTMNDFDYRFCTGIQFRRFLTLSDSYRQTDLSPDSRTKPMIKIIHSEEMSTLFANLSTLSFFVSCDKLPNLLAWSTHSNYRTLKDIGRGQEKNNH